MANCCPITRMSAAKDLRPASNAPVSGETLTALSRKFTMLIEAMDEAIELERDLSHAMSWDPATSGFFEIAEDQWQECLRLASDVFSTAPNFVSDQPLQRMSMLLHFLIGSSSADEAMRFQNLLESNHELFTAEDPECQVALRAAARQVNTLVDLALSAEAQDYLPG